MTDEKKEAIHIPLGTVSRGDPIAEGIEGVDRLIAEGVMNTSLRLKEKLGDRAPQDQDHCLISASCTAYIYGTMYVLIELFRDLGHDDKASTEKALEYLNTAGAMVVKHVSPPETEH